MRNEKKAMIGSIAVIGVIILSFLIRIIGEFFIRLILGMFVLGLGLFLIAITYNAIYDIILGILNWIDERKKEENDKSTLDI